MNINKAKSIVSTVKSTVYKSESMGFQVVPDYAGPAKIIGFTEPKLYSGDGWSKTGIKPILQIPVKNDNGEYFTLVGHIFNEDNPTLSKKSNARRYFEAVLGRPLTQDDIRDGLSRNIMVDQYINIVAEQTSNTRGEIRTYVVSIKPVKVGSLTWNNNGIIQTQVVKNEYEDILNILTPVEPVVVVSEKDCESMWPKE